MQFEQTCWMKPYIDLNTEKRKEATLRGDKAGKDIFQLFNNAVFGKTIENLSKYLYSCIIFIIIRGWRNFLIHHFFALIQTRLPVKLLDMICMLEWAKSRMSSMFQSIQKTISYIHVINMKVVGKFKDECKGQLMLRFVGLRSKLYSFDYGREAHFDCENGDEIDKPSDTSVTRIVLDNKVTPNGVKTSVAKKLSFNDYEYCSNSLLPKRVDITRIGSNLHKVFTYSAEKMDMRWWYFDVCIWTLDNDGYVVMYSLVRICICMYVCMCVYIYIYIYIYIYKGIQF